MSKWILLLQINVLKKKYEACWNFRMYFVFSNAYGNLDCLRGFTCSTASYLELDMNVTDAIQVVKDVSDQFYTYIKNNLLQKKTLVYPIVSPYFFQFFLGINSTII